MRRLSYLNDEIFKLFIDLKDEKSVNFTKQLIYLITDIKVDDLEKMDRELDREFDGTKRSHVDFLAKANGQIIHIEIQKYMAHPALLPRIQLYQSRAFTSQKKKGRPPNEYDKIISIILYEDIYWNDDLLVSYYGYMNPERGKDEYSKLAMYMVELGKINRIYQQKGLDKMSKLEKICFAIKNSDNPLFYDILKVIEENIDEVRFMKEKNDYFVEGFFEELEDFMADVDAACEKQYSLISTLKVLFKTKFNQDASWIENLPIATLEEMVPYLVSDLSYDQLKQKFSS